MSSADLLPHELMQIVASFFETHQIPYRVVGPMASMAYGEPRFTNDVDIVAELKEEHIEPLCAAFPPPQYYVSANAAREAVARRSQFNIIHPASGLKADVIVPPDTEFSRSAASRVRRLTSEGEYSVWFGSPEDVLLNKLVYYQQSGGTSEKHLRDIAGMIRLMGGKLDRAYISAWASKLGVATEWILIRRRVGELGPGSEGP
jgi:hypothetical protein